MGHQRPDRRVGRTRRRLKEALHELIQERPYDEITVRELAERADVGRSTFYSHYATKEDLLFSGFDEWLLSLARAREPEGSGHSASGAGFRFGLPLLEHVRDQERFFRATIVGGREGRIRRETTRLLARMIRVELERGCGAPRDGAADAEGRGGRGEADAPPDMPLEPGLVLEARAHCVAAAFLGLASWWLEHRRRLPPEAVDRLFQSAVEPPG